MSEEFTLHDGGSIGYVINYQPARYKCYSPKSQQYKNGVYGRHQVMNEYGGWDNAHWLDRGLTVIVKDKPDAKLIAAAPELLDALIHIEEYWNRDNNEQAMTDALWHIIETAQDAIAKAKS